MFNLGLVFIFAKIHETVEATILACCDSELVGKTLKHGKINFRVSEQFYKGEQVAEQKLAELLGEFENINLVGKKVVSVAMKAGLVDEKSVIKIGAVPHVQIFKV